MAYSDFKTVSQVKSSFDLSINLMNLFSQIERVEPSDHLKITLKRNLKVAFDNDTEKARSELIIAPLLIEVRERYVERDREAIPASLGLFTLSNNLSTEKWTAVI